MASSANGDSDHVVTRVESYGGERLPPSPLRTLRALNDLSAAELARLADVDRSTVRRLEAGAVHPQAKTARKIAAVLNCPAELLFPKDEDPAGQQGLATTSAVVGDGHGT